MSKIIDFEASGKKDFGCITPEEIMKFCIEHKVDRINFIIKMWKCIKTTEDGEKVEFDTFEDAMKKEADEWCIIQTNIWQFDIN